VRAIEDQFNAATLLWRCLQPQGARTMHNVFSFLKDESGGTAVEYGLVAVGIATAVLAVVNSVGGAINEEMTLISSKFGN
jgi:pilus assembly protein Flp/PilA